uniref:RNase III domain-containing protein n=1 Tax=viral metagenome TaxID=1070528 RepID=A0A6C0JUW5_9ZZZZ
MTTFKDFIFGQMKMAGLKKSTWEPIYKLGFPFFQQAFTHESFRSSSFKDIHEFRSMQFSMEELQSVANLNEIDSLPSYEQLEFTGDKQINVCIAQHLTEKYPGLPAGNLTFSFQKLASEKYLARFGKKQGFFEHILLSPALFNQAILFRDGLPTEIDINFFQGGKIYNIYDKLVEDCVESLAAAMSIAVDKYSESSFGPGLAILYTWTNNGIMKEQDFDATDIDQIKAPGIQLREAWENIYAQRKDAAKKFSNNDMFIIDQTKRKPGYVPIKAINPVTRKVIAETVGLTEQDAKANAAILANDYIKATYAKELEIGKAFKMQKRGGGKPNNFIIQYDDDEY